MEVIQACLQYAAPLQLQIVYSTKMQCMNAHEGHDKAVNILSAELAVTLNVACVNDD